MIRVDWAVLAEAADVDDGLFTVRRGGIDMLTVDELPATEKMSLIARIEGDHDDHGRSFRLGLRIVDGAGEAIVAGWDELPDTILERVARFEGSNPNRPPEAPPVFHWAADFIPQYPAEGVYRVQILIDGNVAEVLSLAVAKM